MNIIAVDDERSALWAIERAVRKLEPNSNIACFGNAAEAVVYARENTVDVAFLDIEMSEMNGISLANQLKEIYAKTNIIFVTGHNDYASAAFGVHASGYVMKPVEMERIAQELKNLRHPVCAAVEKGLRIQCFGNFEVFKDGTPIPFGRSKSREIFAYLVDRRGAGVSKKELAAILWGDGEYTRSKQMQLQVFIAEMMRSLRQAGADDIILMQRGVYALDTARVDCDYYDYAKGIPEAINGYQGEYMTNYAWAERTAGTLADTQ